MIVHHRPNRQALKNLKKQQHILREVDEPPDQLKLSSKEIDDNIIMIDVSPNTSTQRD
jgi:hypothetical protein